MTTAYTILQTRRYYGPRRETVPLLDREGQPVRYASRDADRREIARLNATVYETAHNESGRPSYIVARIGGRRCPINHLGRWTPRS